MFIFSLHLESVQTISSMLHFPPQSRSVCPRIGENESELLGELRFLKSNIERFRNLKFLLCFALDLWSLRILISDA